MFKKPTCAKIQFDLTAAQKAQIEPVQGAASAAPDLAPELLEERAAPRCIVIYKDQMTPK